MRDDDTVHLTTQQWMAAGKFGNSGEAESVHNSTLPTVSAIRRKGNTPNSFKVDAIFQYGRIWQARGSLLSV